MEVKEMVEGINLVILTIVNWAHLFTTVVWFGAMTTMFFILVPAAKAALEPPVMGKFMGVLAKKMKTAVYISIVVLIVTGALIMVLTPSEAGFDLGSRVGMVLIVKLILVAVMIFVGVHISENIVPKIGKLAAEGPGPEMAKLQKKQMSLGMFNFILSLIVLLLSGYMKLLS